MYAEMDRQMRLAQSLINASVDYRKKGLNTDARKMLESAANIYDHINVKKV